MVEYNDFCSELKNCICKILKFVLNALLIIGIIFIIFYMLYLSGKSRLENEMTMKAKAFEQGYIEACKDFNRGKLKYKLIENDDGSKTWQKIE